MAGIEATNPTATGAVVFRHFLPKQKVAARLRAEPIKAR
jgi:hypothetical protein